jgi:hypothetical protein
MLKVFGQQELASGDPRRGHDARIPAGQTGAILQCPGGLEQVAAGLYRSPGQQVADVRAGLLGVRPGLSLRVVAA